MAKNKEKSPPFEEGLEQLENIVQQLEDGELPLEKSLELYFADRRAGAFGIHVVDIHRRAAR